MNYLPPVAAPEPGLLASEDVLPVLSGWHAAGQRAALVTLVGIEGGSPRGLGAQMAVCEDGSYAGYLSGGCLEQAIALEAQALLASGTNRLVRYGRGSPYFDIKLPCGSGLDVYFDCSLTPEAILDMARMRRDRTPFALVSDLDQGSAHIETGRDAWARGSLREGSRFTRTYVPTPRMSLFGAGPSVPALYRLAQTLGLDVQAWGGDEPTRKALDALGLTHAATPSAPDAFLDTLDGFSAVVLSFHEHSQEPAILERALSSDAFYIGVLGNHAVHRARLAQLEAAGHAKESLARIRAPIGVIAQAKSQATLAMGILTEVLIEAKARNLVP
jgi:xanthine dehydrogenase accessory factor